MPHYSDWKKTGFGGVLAVLRAEKGLTQSALAELIGCHKNTVAKIERNEQEPAWPMVLACCRALGVGPERFVNGLAEKKAVRGRPRRGQSTA